jgi:hypothetical protein
LFGDVESNHNPWYRRVKQRTSQIADRVDLPSEITVCIFIAPHSHDPATPPFPAVSLSMMPGAPRIPKRMSFFWAGGPMSWLRYLTLASFRHLNPNWEMRIYHCPTTSRKT